MYVIIQSVVFYDTREMEENGINFDYYVSLYVYAGISISIFIG